MTQYQIYFRNYNYLKVKLYTFNISTNFRKQIYFSQTCHFYNNLNKLILLCIIKWVVSRYVQIQMVNFGLFQEYQYVKTAGVKFIRPLNNICQRNQAKKLIETYFLELKILINFLTKFRITVKACCDMLSLNILFL